MNAEKARAKVEERQRDLDRIQLLDDVRRFGRAEAVRLQVIRMLRRLGHVPMTQGGQIECFRCGRGGTIELGVGFAPARVIGSIDNKTHCPAKGG